MSRLRILGGAYPSEMPAQVKTRGMAYYLVAFQAASALGSLSFGANAQATNLTTALLTACGSSAPAWSRPGSSLSMFPGRAGVCGRAVSLSDRVIRVWEVTLALRARRGFA